MEEDGKLLSEHIFDQEDREVERKEYREDGGLLRYNFYEHVGSGRKYQRVRSFGPNGQLILEHEQGKPPVISG